MEPLARLKLLRDIAMDALWASQSEDPGLRLTALVLLESNPQVKAAFLQIGGSLPTQEREIFQAPPKVTPKPTLVPQCRMMFGL